jgi:hypothetical protein
MCNNPQVPVCVALCGRLLVELGLVFRGLGLCDHGLLMDLQGF